MRKECNIKISGSKGRPILLDVFWQENRKAKPVVIFAHGFKGFKDWGCWDKIAERFAGEGFVFIKFNFSHNGTTLQQPAEFNDLEAFGNNSFSIELDDLGTVIDWVYANDELQCEMDLSRLSLIGHSRGGGICVIKAAEDKRVAKLVTWAGVAALDRILSFDPEEWKRKGVMYTINGRTGQQMPLYYQLYEDFQRNRERLDVIAACKKITIPSLIIHGACDEAVPLSQAEELHSNINGSKLCIIPNGTHTFGMKHPCEDSVTNNQAIEIVKLSLKFLK